MKLSAETFNALTTGKPIVRIARERQKKHMEKVIIITSAISLSIFILLNQKTEASTQIQSPNQTPSSILGETELELDQNGLPSTQDLITIARQYNLIDFYDYEVQDIHINTDRQVVRIIFQNQNTITFDKGDIYLGLLTNDTNQVRGRLTTNPN